MSMSYDDRGKKLRSGLAKTLMVMNGLIAFGMAFYWSGVGRLVGEPFRWAMRDGVSPAPSLFEYPYLMLWLVPLLCMCGGWLSLKAQYGVAARAIGLYPAMLLSLILGWYHLTPQHWH